MGCSSATTNCPADAQGPAGARTVTLKAYEIQTYEVTNEDYKKCTDAFRCSFPVFSTSATRPTYWSNVRYVLYPVIWVDWGRADTYCKWLGGRLPTEAEWEKAARGTGGFTYPWGEGLPNTTLANYANIKADTFVYWTFSSDKSPFHIYEMAGNVSEWVSDWYGADYYATAPDTDPTGPATGTDKVLRGGNWSTMSDAQLMNFYRGHAVGDFFGHYNTVGFRCARDVP